MKITAIELYDRLVNEFDIYKKEGKIFFQLGDIDIIVKKRDVVGNIIQEWVYEWLRKNNVEFERDEGQLPPDLFLSPEDKTYNLVEIKAFNYQESPAFDIAEPLAYLEEIVKRPYMLYTDYLIFGYKMDEETGIITIENMWLKKMCEICSPSKTKGLPIGGQAVKIRPSKWFNRTKRATPNFSSLEDYLSAFVDLLYHLYNGSKHSEIAKTAKERIITSDQRHFPDKDLHILWFDAIKEKYFPPRK